MQKPTHMAMNKSILRYPGIHPGVYKYIQEYTEAADLEHLDSLLVLLSRASLILIEQLKVGVGLVHHFAVQLHTTDLQLHATLALLNHVDLGLEEEEEEEEER